MSEQLAAALAAEEAAIYAYGALGVHLSGEGKVDEARESEEEHRQRRDTVVTMLSAQSASTAPAPAGYQLPFEVTDQASAVKLAIQVEDGVAQAWRAVLPVSEGDDRATALTALTDAAVRATRWRRLGEVTPSTMAWPGRPS